PQRDLHNRFFILIIIGGRRSPYISDLIQLTLQQQIYQKFPDIITYKNTTQKGSILSKFLTDQD
ncbi:hypothetical protein, partial [Bacteroides heparinolyticus]